MSFWVRNKDGIIIGFISGILFIFIQSPILKFGDYIISLLLSMSESFSSLYYTSIATYGDNRLHSASFVISITSLGIIFIIAFACIQIIFFVENIHTEEETNNNRSVHSYIHESKKNKLSKNLLFIALSFILISYGAFIWTMNTSKEDKFFHKKLIAIKPYVQPITVDKLNSRWVTIKGKDDYDKIMKELNSYMAQNKLSIAE